VVNIGGGVAPPVETVLTAIPHLLLAFDEEKDNMKIYEAKHEEHNRTRRVGAKVGEKIELSSMKPTQTKSTHFRDGILELVRGVFPGPTRNALISVSDSKKKKNHLKPFLRHRWKTLLGNECSLKL
jgi:hypothetical protein